MGLLSIDLTQVEPGRETIITHIMNPDLEMRETSALPFWEQGALSALLKVLEHPEYRAERFSADERAWLCRAGLLTGDAQQPAYAPDMRAVIGQKLFDCLFPTSEMRGAYDQVRRQWPDEPVHIQFRFDSTNTEVGALPWELVCDRGRFLVGGTTGELTRYITFDQAPPERSVVEKLRVLLISPRPADVPALDDREARAIEQVLTRCDEASRITLTVLTPPSFAQLKSYLSHQPGTDTPHVIHFDGHGAYGRRCEQCKAVTQARDKTVCRACGRSLQGAQPQGYLVFCDDGGAAEYVSTREVSDLLGLIGGVDASNAPGALRLVVLSACRSAVARDGESVFGGVAQGVIGARIPAVIAMQFAVQADKAAQFADCLYSRLARGEPLAKAMTWGRTILGRDGDHWYRPVLYLRWRDNWGGRLFLPAPPAAARSGVPAPQPAASRAAAPVEPPSPTQIPAPPPPAQAAVAGSVGTVRNNLPLPLVSFVGREWETAEVKRLLAEHRMVTLTGARGAGKTELAVRAAAALQPELEDDVWLVDLGPLTDPGLVPQTVAERLSVREEPGHPLLDTLTTSLASRRLLLVLDDCDQMDQVRAECVTLAGALLRACPGLRILATSRERLGLPEETVWWVPSLSVPNPYDLPRLEGLSKSEAVRHFLFRARAVKPDFSLTEQSAAPVAQLCHRLSGIPLALELVAAQVKALSVEQMQAELDHRLPPPPDPFRSPPDGAVPVPTRDETVRRIVAWVHDMSTEREQILWRRLSVFAGRWTAEAAQAVCAGPDGDDGLITAGEVGELLPQFMSKSLLVRASAGGGTVYRLREAIRRYGAEQLRHWGEEAAIEQRHRAWYRQWAEAAEPAFRGGGQAEWVARFEAEHENLRAALGWKPATHRDVEDMLRLAWAMGHFWYIRGHFGEGRRWLEGALASGARVDPAVEARARNLLGLLAYHQGDYEAAESQHGQALTLAEDVQDTRSAAFAHGGLGLVEKAQGDYEGAAAHFDSAWELFQQCGDLWGVARALGDLGLVLHCQDQHGRAAALLVESLRLHRRLNDAWGTALSLTYLGGVMHALADAKRRELGEEACRDLYDRAEARHEEGLALSRKLGYKRGITLALHALAYAADARGDGRRAAALFTESLAIERDLGDRQGIADSLQGLAVVAISQGDPERAVRLLAAARALREAMHVRLPPADTAAFERHLQAARAELIGAAFENASNEGAAMTLERAVAYAFAAPAPGFGRQRA